MTDATRLAARDDVVWADVEGELVLLHSGTGAYFALNESGAELWRRLGQDGASEAELVEALMAAYRVERPDAERDVRQIVDELRAADLVVAGEAGAAQYCE
jgi:PqqD family protein of HPr-rel-A system